MALYVHYLYVLGVRKPYQKRRPIPFAAAGSHKAAPVSGGNFNLCGKIISRMPVS